VSEGERDMRSPMKRELLTRLLYLDQLIRHWGWVGYGLMCEHRGFGITCTAACELEIGDVVGTYYPVEDVENVFWYALCLLYEFFVTNEAIAAA
jgi:hypothetical protein